MDDGPALSHNLLQTCETHAVNLIAVQQVLKPTAMKVEVRHG